MVHCRQWGICFLFMHVTINNCYTEHLVNNPSSFTMLLADINSRASTIRLIIELILEFHSHHCILLVRFSPEVQDHPRSLAASRSIWYPNGLDWQTRWHKPTQQPITPIPLESQDIHTVSGQRLSRKSWSTASCDRKPLLCLISALGSARQ